MRYIKQLDSIRAIAVTLVIIAHWIPEDTLLYTATSLFNGVDIFFVLSGFLITQILLENRNEAERLGIRKGIVFKNFFIRRVLRIFPIYYLTIFALLLLGKHTGTSIRSNFIYFFTYTSNFYFYKNGFDGMLSHLWSLAVEEQFYLMWPFVMVLLPKRFLLPAIFIFIATGIFSRLFFSSVLTFTCFDAFGMGAFLAWCIVFAPGWLSKLYPVFFMAAMVAVIFQIIRVTGNGFSARIFSRLLTSVFTTWLIFYIILNKEKKHYFFSALLNNRVLIFIGKISYGVYLYHNILPKFTRKAFSWLNDFLPAFFIPYRFYLLAIENFCFLILLSWLSWKVIEKPFLELKKYFGYQQPKATVATEMANHEIGLQRL